MKALRHLILIVCILAASVLNAAAPPQVAASSKPATDEFRLAYPNKDHLTAVQLYQMGYAASAAAIDKNIGHLVLLDVVVVIERDAPLVDIEIPKELASAPKPPHHPIQAHLITVTTQASSCKKGQRLRIEGIIVDEGYGAYMIYLHQVQPIK